MAAAVAARAPRHGARVWVAIGASSDSSLRSPGGTRVRVAIGASSVVVRSSFDIADANRSHTQKSLPC